MADGEKPLNVYLQVGFKNLSHFSTAFKKEYGIPPSEFIAEAVKHYNTLYLTQKNE